MKLLSWKTKFLKTLNIYINLRYFPCQHHLTVCSFLKQFLSYLYLFILQAISNRKLPKQKVFNLQPHHREVPLPQTLLGAQKVIFLPAKTTYNITHPEAF